MAKWDEVGNVHTLSTDNFQTPMKSLCTAQGKILRIFISRGGDF